MSEQLEAAGTGTLNESEREALQKLSQMRSNRTLKRGLRKAAILLVALDSETAAAVFKSLPEDEMEMISQEIAGLGVVKKEEMLEVLEEFKELVIMQKLIREGGYQNAIDLISKSLPKNKAARLVRLLDAQREAVPFHFLEHTEADVLVTFLQEEHPQTVAVVLSYMQPPKAAAILASMSQESQIDIVKRIANLGHTSPEAIRNVEAGLRKYLNSLAFEEFQEVGGVKTVSEVLNVMDRATERVIMESIEEESPDLAEEIKKLMFVFEDLVLVDNKGMQAVLKEVESRTLALALKLASDELKNKIFKNMSSRAAELIQDELKYIGPARISDVEAAQQSIVEIVRRLEESGEVVVSGRGCSDNVVV